MFSYDLILNHAENCGNHYSKINRVLNLVLIFLLWPFYQKLVLRVLPPVPNTDKIMKSRGTKPRGLYCFRGVWIR